MICVPTDDNHSKRAVPAQRLSPEEEIELADIIQNTTLDENQRVIARNRLVESHLPLVVGVAQQLTGRGLPIEDLIAEGNLALLKVAGIFQPSFGNRFSSFAVWRVRGAMIDALREHGQQVDGISRSMVTNWKAVSEVEERLSQQLGRSPESHEVAEAMEGFEASDITAILDANHGGLSLDAPASAPGGGFSDDKEPPLIETLADAGPLPDEVLESEELRFLIERALTTLPAHEADVLRLYYGIGREHGFTLKEIGNILGVSESRASQIKTSAELQLYESHDGQLLMSLIGNEGILRLPATHLQRQLVRLASGIYAYPDLAAEYSLRNVLLPSKVIPGTGKKLWWSCQTCQHEWRATGHNRVQGKGCPACAGKVATSGNNLVAKHTELAREFLSRNRQRPHQIVCGSNKRCWWKCSVCGYEWETKVCHRTAGSGCPACARRVVTEKNNLTVTHPWLVRQYASDKNPLTAEQVLAGTHQKLWWRCDVCSHEWQVSGAHRAQGSGCPACKGNKVVTVANSLAVMNPLLVREYSVKNALPANQVRASTRQKLLWECSRCGHEWRATGDNRARGKGCPACSGRVPSRANNLAATHPELAREFLVARNSMGAFEVIAGTSKKLWWVCSQCGHEWQAVGYSRVSGAGCPMCAKRKKLNAA